MQIQNPRIRSCANPQQFRWLFQFFSCQIFFVHFLKYTFQVFFQNQKKLATKRLKLPSKLLDNFTSCHAAVFKLHKVSLFF